MLERQIEFLREIGVEEIIVVTGYLSEKFEYLKDKYGVKLIKNDKYDIYNNIYTMYLVRKYLGDSYVIDGDVYLHKNFLDKKISKSTYYSGYKKEFKNEWIIVSHDNNNVKDIIIGDGEGYILSGISYWSMKDASIIIDELERVIEKNDFKDLYWDDIVKNNLFKLDVQIKKIETTDSFEIDSLSELESLNKFLNAK